MKKKVLEVSAIRASFFLFEPILSASYGGRSTEYKGMDMRWQLLESEEALKPEYLLCPFVSVAHLLPQAGDNHGGKSSLLHPARRRQAFLLSIFHMVSILKICYNYRKFNAEVCSLWLLEG